MGERGPQPTTDVGAAGGVNVFLDSRLLERGRLAGRGSQP